MFPCVFPNGHRQVRKMIRVLLVDDELLSRMTVRSLINWEKEGYTICGECSDGTQAWAAIPSLRPQIVITDVKMNRMFDYTVF